MAELFKLDLSEQDKAIEQYIASFDAQEDAMEKLRLKYEADCAKHIAEKRRLKDEIFRENISKMYQIAFALHGKNIHIKSAADLYMKVTDTTAFTKDNKCKLILYGPQFRRGFVKCSRDYCEILDDIWAGIEIEILSDEEFDAIMLQ